jgi:hypothetical protein
MALLVCLKCTTRYSVGAPACPHCGGKKSVEQGSKGDPALAAPAENESGPADTVPPVDPSKEA